MAASLAENAFYRGDARRGVQLPRSWFSRSAGERFATGLLMPATSSTATGASDWPARSPGGSFGGSVLISVSTPLADLRPFTTNYSERVGRPDWSVPLEQEFVRSLGPLRPRPLDWGDAFLREGWFCDATRTTGAAGLRRRSGMAGLTRVYSRLYVDGGPVTRSSAMPDDLVAETGGVLAKFETGFIFRARRLDPLDSSLGPLVRTAVTLPICIRGTTRARQLVRLGRALAPYFEDNTVRTKHGVRLAERTGLVVPGQAFVLCHLKRSERLRMPGQGCTALPTPKDARHSLYQWRFSVDGSALPAWFLVDREVGARPMSRRLRLYLMRLHNEHEVLRALVRNLHNPLIVSADAEAKDRLQLFVRNSLRRIAKLSHSSTALAGYETGGVGRYTGNVIRESDQTALLDRLKALDLRPNIERRVAEYIERDVEVARFTIGTLNLYGGIRVTQNSNTNYGVQGGVQQAGHNARQAIDVVQSDGADISEQLAVLERVLDLAKGDMGAQNAAEASKCLKRLQTELETPDTKPEKGVVLEAIERLGKLSETAGSYAGPIAQVLTAVRTMLGL